MTEREKTIGGLLAIANLASALQGLVDAIDFEGEHGSTRFNPGGPFEDDRLRAARAALAKLEG